MSGPLVTKFHVGRQDIENVQESSAGHHSPTYIVASDVALESAGVDLDICITGKDCSALEVACGPPGIGAKTIQEISENKIEITYMVSAIALKRAIIDLHSRLINSNSSALEIACPPPGIGAEI
jgi:hypothetical protein